jgi:predicted HicB family RNase H-like nuclease
MIKEALHSYIYSCIKHNDEIPEPIKPSEFKGNIAYRTTPEKHYKLAKRAGVTGKSVNKLVDEAVEYYLENKASNF